MILKNLVNILIAISITMSCHNNQLISKDMKEVTPKISSFPIGNKLPEIYSKYFIGQAYIAQLTQNKDLNCPISNVTFEPGCRNNWHSHSGGQILIVVGGNGYYQVKGEPAHMLLSGDVVEIPANVIHWHGATPESWFSHLAIETNPQNNIVSWLEPVGDEEYTKATTIANNSDCRLSEDAIKNHETWFPGYESKVKPTDPELIEIFDNFAFDEVLNHGKLTFSFLVSMGGCESQVKGHVQGNINVGNDKDVLIDVVTQLLPYIGYPRTLNALKCINEVNFK